MRTAKEAAAFFKAKDTNRVGMCLWHVQDAFLAPHVQPNAISQWRASKKKHSGGRTPRLGAPVFYEGGQHGHVAIYVGNGRVRSTDAGGSGRMATVSLNWFASAWGYKYLGWTGDIGGRDIEFVERVDVKVSELRYGQNDSDSVRFLRRCLIKRGYLKVSKPLSVERPGNKYTKAVGEAVKTWQRRKGYRQTGELTNTQVKAFFAPNKRVRLHLVRVQN